MIKLDSIILLTGEYISKTRRLTSLEQQSNTSSGSGTDQSSTDGLGSTVTGGGGGRTVLTSSTSTVLSGTTSSVGSGNSSDSSQSEDNRLELHYENSVCKIMNGFEILLLLYAPVESRTPNAMRAELRKIVQPSEKKRKKNGNRSKIGKFFDANGDAGGCFPAHRPRPPVTVPPRAVAAQPPC